MEKKLKLLIKNCKNDTCIFNTKDYVLYSDVKSLLTELKKENDNLNKDYIKAMEISFKVSFDNNKLNKEIEKIKGEKKKEYLRAQRLVTEVAKLKEELKWVLKNINNAKSWLVDPTEGDIKAALICLDNAFDFTLSNKK